VSRGFNLVAATRLPINRHRRALIALDVPRSRASSGCTVIGVGYCARLEGETSTTDAATKIIPQSNEFIDAGVEIRSPSSGEFGPIRLDRTARIRQGSKRSFDLRERQTDLLGGADNRDCPQCGTLIAALIASCSPRSDEASIFVIPRATRRCNTRCRTRSRCDRPLHVHTGAARRRRATRERLRDRRGPDRAVSCGYVVCSGSERTIRSAHTAPCARCDRSGSETL
jgi:hypothetical protein